MPGTQVGGSKVTARGQITLPKKVKELLGVHEGDYILFFREDRRLYVEVGRLVVKSRGP